MPLLQNYFFALMCNEWIFLFEEKNNISFSRYLDYFAFVKWEDFKICDVIIGIAKIMEFTLMRISFEAYVLSKWNLVKY